jgi:hypothetical protein
MGPSSAKEYHREGRGIQRHLSTLVVARPEIVMRQSVTMSYLDAQGASLLSILVPRPEAHTATVPANATPRTTPEGSQIIALRPLRGLETGGETSGTDTGGVAALNHRLMATTPPGSGKRRGTVGHRYRWCRCAQPPANGCDPSWGRSPGGHGTEAVDGNHCPLFESSMLILIFWAPSP